MSPPALRLTSCISSLGGSQKSNVSAMGPDKYHPSHNRTSTRITHLFLFIDTSLEPFGVERNQIAFQASAGLTWSTITYFMMTSIAEREVKRRDARDGPPRREDGPCPEARPEGGNYKAGVSGGMSLGRGSWAARSSFAMQMARTSHARTLTVALFFLLLPVTGFSTSRERR